MIRKGMWRILAVMLVILVPLKTAAELFWQEYNAIWENVLPWVFVGACLLLFLVCRLDKRVIMRFRPRSYPAAGVTALLAAVGILISSLYTLVRFVRRESDATAVSMAGDQPLLIALCAICGILAAIVMAAWGVSLFRTGALFREHPIAALIPPIWACLELAVLFVTYTAQSKMSINFYSIFPFVLVLLFLFAQSSFFSDAGGGVARRKFYQYGAPLVLMGLGSSVPALIRLALGLDTGSSLSAPLLVTLLTLSLYALFSMIAVRRDTNLLLRPGKDKAPLSHGDSGFSMTLELDRVLSDWKQMNGEEAPSQEEEKGDLQTEDLLEDEDYSQKK